MTRLKIKVTLLIILTYVGVAFTQVGGTGRPVLGAQLATIEPQQNSGESSGGLDAKSEKRALLILLKSVQSKVVSAAEAMPADKYGFAPTDGEFKGVRTFGQEAKHLAATNHILAAAALGENPPADAGDETGPETVRTKAEILEYLSGSFAHLVKAMDAIGDKNVAVKSTPISPLNNPNTTRFALVVEALIHAFDHYGQMVEYLRMNGVVPPASRP
jgi:uncharacterized damage-inducible protein DinB